MNDFSIIIPFEKTVENGELKLFGGIASSTSLDRDNERMDKSVMRKIASDLKKNSAVFFNHNTKGLGVGTISSAEEVGDFVKISVIPTKAKGMEDVITQINEGILKSFSVGGRIKDYEDKVDDFGKRFRLIKDVECYEVSVVGIPSNPDASILHYIGKSFVGGHMAEQEKSEPEKIKTEIAKSMTAEDFVKSEEFKKVFEGFQKDYESRLSEMKKSFEAEKESMTKSITSANARIDELHKALDTKSKALASENETELHTQKDVNEKGNEQSFSFFKR